MSFLDQHSRISILNLPFPNYKKGNFQAYADEPPTFTNRHIGGIVYSGDLGVVLRMGKGALGFGFYGSAGTGSDWKDVLLLTKGVYRTIIMAFNVPFCFAYRVSDTVSLGANLSLLIGITDRESGKTNISINNPSVSYYYRSKSDGTGIGAEATLGMLWKPIQWFSGGIIFRSPYLLYARGTASMQHTAYPLYPGGPVLPVRDSTGLVTKWFYPVRAGAGVAFRPAAWVTIAVDAYWVNWSSMYFDFDYRRTTFYFIDRKVNFHLHDTVQAKIGVEFIVGIVSIRAGFYTDPSPYRNDMASVLTPRFSNAWIITGGMGLKFQDISIDASYNHAFVENRKAQMNAIGGSVDIVSLGLRFSFM